MLHAARSGDYGPLIFYVIAIGFCLALAFDVGKCNSRIEAKLKAGPFKGLYAIVPSWMFRYVTPLGGLALITVGIFLI
jgi:hypothetical protein